MTYVLTLLNGQTKTMLICLWSMRGLTRNNRLKTYIHLDVWFLEIVFQYVSKAVSECGKSE